MITGAARGIGFSIAEACANEGARLVLSDINSEQLGAAAKELTGAADSLLPIQVDVSDPDSVANMVESAMNEFGRIDVLVNNAGITQDGLLIRMDDEQWNRVININLTGTFLCLRAVAQIMLKQRSGRIINMASVVGVMGNAGQSNYSASKAGVIGLTKSAAKELASRGITCNAIAPGFIKTEMTDKMTDKAKAAVLDAVPLKSMGTPEDVANLVVFLGSDEAAYITGQVVQIDGGLRT